MSKQGLSHRKPIVLSTTQEDCNECFKNIRALCVSTCISMADGKNCGLSCYYSVKRRLYILARGPTALSCKKKGNELQRSLQIRGDGAGQWVSVAIRLWPLPNLALRSQGSLAVSLTKHIVCSTAREPQSEDVPVSIILMNFTIVESLRQALGLCLTLNAVLYYLLCIWAAV